MDLLGVYNLALSFAHEGSVTSTTDTEDTRVAFLSLIYEQRVRELLQIPGTDWEFVRSDVPLTEFTDVDIVTGWTYQYERPDCLVVRMIFTEGDSYNAWEYEEFVVEDATASPVVPLTKVIQTHLAPNTAPWRPFARVTLDLDQTADDNVALWSYPFVLAVTQSLASSLLYRFSRSPGHLKLASQLAAMALAGAQSASHNSGTGIKRPSKYVSCRS